MYLVDRQVTGESQEAMSQHSGQDKHRVGGPHKSEEIPYNPFSRHFMVKHPVGYPYQTLTLFANNRSTSKN